MSLEMSSLLAALGILVASVVFSRLSRYLIIGLERQIFHRTRTSLDDIIVGAVHGPLAAAILLGGLNLALGRLSFLPEEWQGWLDRNFYLVYLMLAYIVVYRLIGGLAKWYGKEVVSETDTELDDKFLSFFRQLAIIILTTVLAIFLLGHFGIEPDALITTLGIGSLAIALAAQATLADVIAGFVIMVDRPFAVGDRVEILDIETWGDVKEVGLRSTRILTRDNRMVAIPNSVIGKGLIVNYSVPSTMYRVETHAHLAYGTDVERVREVMIAAIRAESWVMQDQPVEALLLEFGESALTFRVRCWIEDYVETRRILDKMNSAIYAALEREEFDFAIPQRQVFLPVKAGLKED